MACLAARWGGATTGDPHAEAGLPVALEDLRRPPSPERIIAGLAKVRQIRDGNLRFVLPTDLGPVVITDDVTEDEIQTAWGGIMSQAYPR